MKRNFIELGALACLLSGAPAAVAQTPAPAAPAPAAAPAPNPDPAAVPAPPAAAPAPAPARPPVLAPAPAFDLGAPSPAPFPDIPVATDDTPGVTPTLEVWIGFHDQLVGTRSLDAFSEDDQVPAFHAGASVALSDFGTGQLALVASADLGGTDASLREQPTELGVRRFGLGPELRFPVLESLSLFGRLSPQAVQVSTELVESSSGVRLGQDQWAFGVDASLGACIRVAALHPSGFERPIGVFLRLEGGYFWSPALDLELAPVGGNAPVRTAPLAFGELELHGVSFGAGVGIGY